MGAISEILETSIDFKEIVSITVLISFFFCVMTYLSLKKWGFRALLAIVPIFILFIIVPVVTIGQLKLRNNLPDPDPDLYIPEAKQLLTSIADAQILYFAENNRWAGYPDNNNVFTTLGWSPGNPTHYAYYCGNDYLLPKTSIYAFNYPEPENDWPYGVYPDITLSDFTCMAIGNNDRDEFPDVWMINKFKKPVHLIDDASNTMLVDIVSAPFDAERFVAKAINGEGDETASRIYIEINMPAYRLRLYEGGRHLKSYPVAIGMRGYKTPRRNFHIERIVWNPWWIPPNAAWCRKKDEETGKEIGCRPKGPGPGNPLGPVKIVLQSAILIHGTNKPYTIGRSASHGCIRMYSKDAIDLAWKLMVLAGSKQPVARKELYPGKSRKTHRVSLMTNVQVATVYRRLEVFDKFLLLHPDIYRWQPFTPEKIRQSLIEYGLTLSTIDEEHRGNIYRGNPAKTLFIPITF